MFAIGFEKSPVCHTQLAEEQKEFPAVVGVRELPRPDSDQGSFCAPDSAVPPPGLVTPSNTRSRGPALESEDPLPLRNTSGKK